MKKRKVKRYNGEEGSSVDSDYAYDPISKITGEAEMERGQRMEAMDQGGGERGPKPMPSDVPEERKVSFKQAFASARKAGDKTFEWQGKKYTTEMAKTRADEDEGKAERRMTAIGDKWREDKKAREAAAVPKASAAEMERRKKMEKEQALEAVAPEMNLIGGPGLKAVQKGAQALAAREAAKNVVKKRIEPSFRPIKDITPGPEKIGMAPRRIGNEPLKIGMKKGGTVKTATASKRADGIAQRGKTRGRIC